ncbi:MAG: AAA family ATPase [Methyloprofundus sp.]|nr:AAA family ATPase [Methyloprofundus sp.]
MSTLEKALEKSEQIAQTNTEKSVVKNRVKSGLGGTIPSTKRTVNIDWEELSTQGYLSLEQGNSGLAEEYRMIKRPLLYNAFGKAAEGIERSNLILVTSSVPEEGKTFTAINLAMSIANERDKNVLLIDADVAKPTLAKRLGVTASPGLIEYLEDDSLNFSDISLATDVANLQIIPAGKRHTFSTELLSSNRMVQFVDELSQCYSDRIVIFDSPPLLAATQAEVLAGLVGQIVLVIAAETTMQSTVQEAIKRLEERDVVLALLNKAKYGLTMDYYGYGQYGAEH